MVRLSTALCSGRVSCTLLKSCRCAVSLLAAGFSRHQVKTGDADERVYVLLVRKLSLSGFLMYRLQAKKLATRNLEISRNFVKSANGGSSNFWVNTTLEFLLSAVAFVCPVAFTQVLISAFPPLFCTVSAIRANTKDLTEEQQCGFYHGLPFIFYCTVAKLF